MSVEILSGEAAVTFVFEEEFVYSVAPDAKAGLIASSSARMTKKVGALRLII